VLEQLTDRSATIARLEPRERARKVGERVEGRRIDFAECARDRITQRARNLGAGAKHGMQEPCDLGQSRRSVGSDV
jgi:hypothetical protein